MLEVTIKIVTATMALALEPDRGRQLPIHGTAGCLKRLTLRLR